jgi:hypothetical protein
VRVGVDELREVHQPDVLQRTLAPPGAGR